MSIWVAVTPGAAEDEVAAVAGPDQATPPMITTVPTTSAAVETPYCRYRPNALPQSDSGELYVAPSPRALVYQLLTRRCWKAEGVPSWP